MRTQPESKACRVYCISGNGQSGGPAARVSGDCAQGNIQLFKPIICLFISERD